VVTPGQKIMTVNLLVLWTNPTP